MTGPSTRRLSFRLRLLAVPPLVLALLTFPASAQQDPLAAKILDAMSAKYTMLKSFQGGFTQTLENPAAKLKENINGDLIVSGPKYRLVSGGKEITSDAMTTWIFDKADNEVTITNMDEMNADLTPPRLFTFYKTGYKYQLLKTVKQGGLTYNLIELSPNNKTNEVYKVQLLVAQMDKSLGSMKTFKKNGTLTTLTFNNFKANVPITTSTFSFDKSKHPGVKVVDLRDGQTKHPQATATPWGNPPVGKIPIDKLRLRKPRLTRPKLNK